MVFYLVACLLAALNITAILGYLQRVDRVSRDSDALGYVFSKWYYSIRIISNAQGSKVTSLYIRLYVWSVRNKEEGDERAYCIDVKSGGAPSLRLYPKL